MANWSQTAFVFPGQGSQFVGMGKDFYDTYEIARNIFHQADEIIGFQLSEIMFDGPQEALDDTSHTQPAMYVCSIAMLKTLQDLLPAAIPAYVAGHSLGEITALTASNALSFEAGVLLVKERGRLMRDAGEKSPGGMAAVLGLGNDEVHQICKQASDEIGAPVVLANDNCPGQIVISGNEQALHRAIELAKNLGAKRAIPLAVSTAPHSPLMKPAESAFIQIVESTQFQEPSLPVYANISAKPLHSAHEIKIELEGQLTNPVHWTDSVQNMIKAGAKTFVEIGAKNVLTGLIKRIDNSVDRINIDSVNAMNDFIATR